MTAAASPPAFLPSITHTLETLSALSSLSLLFPALFLSLLSSDNSEMQSCESLSRARIRMETNVTDEIRRAAAAYATRLCASLIIFIAEETASE